jgi:hypothetical protein
MWALIMFTLLPGIAVGLIMQSVMIGLAVFVVVASILAAFVCFQLCFVDVVTKNAAKIYADTVADVLGEYQHDH